MSETKEHSLSITTYSMCLILIALMLIFVYRCLKFKKGFSTFAKLMQHNDWGHLTKVSFL